MLKQYINAVDIKVVLEDVCYLTVNVSDWK